MTLQIDPAFKAAYRETQGQPVDAEPRLPIVAAQQDGGLVERLRDISTRMSGHVDAGDVWDAATAFAEKDARIAELAEQTVKLENIIIEQERRITAARAECEGLRAALEPSAETKAAYSGEFFMGVTLRSGREEDYRRVQIPWDSIKTIMAAIAARAALSQKETGA